MNTHIYRIFQSSSFANAEHKEIITLFTPTFNRAKYLKRVYSCLLKQTSKNFVWIIVNDGSSDNTEEIVLTFIKENKIPIKYIHKENGGKHSAFKVALENCNTNYFQCMDDDDIYDCDAVEFYLNEWNKVENKSIGAIRTIARDKNNKFVMKGQFEMKDKDFIDCSTLEMNYLNNVWMENWTCYRTDALKSVELFPEKYWLENYHKFFMESIWQSRFARKYKSRYIFKSLRQYSDDSETSLLRAPKNEDYYLNMFINTKFTLEEQYDYIIKNKRLLLRYIAQLQILRGYFKFSIKDLKSNISNGKIIPLINFTNWISLFGRFYIKKKIGK